ARFKKNYITIASKYSLNNNNFYRGTLSSDNVKNIFSRDASFTKNSIFDNSYDLIIEFSFLGQGKECYNEIGSHHPDSYRGNIDINNIKIHKIFYNIFSEFDLTKNLKDIKEYARNLNTLEVYGIVYDMIDCKNIYICNHFLIN